MQAPAPSSVPAITGIVSGFASRFEVASGQQLLVWNFNLVAEDSAHQRFEVPVQMRGTTFEGAIQNGDIISVDAPWRPGQILQVTSVVNVNTRATITANNPHPSPWGRVIAGLIIVIFVGFFAFLVIGALLAALGIRP